MPHQKEGLRGASTNGKLAKISGKETIFKKINVSIIVLFCLGKYSASFLNTKTISFLTFGFAN